MTKQEAIDQLSLLLDHCESMMTSEFPVWARDCDALKTAISALKGPTREQVKKVRGEWIDRRALSDAPAECSNCGEWVYGKVQDVNFCPFCGVPMTDEAVDMVMERLEEMRNDQ